jgi:cell division protein FtsB
MVPAGAPGTMPTRTRPARVRPARSGAGLGTGPARAGRPVRSGRGRIAPESRTRFFFLVVALLGGGLLCLLLVNTILAAGAFKITALQQGNVALAQREQSLQAQIAAEEAPSALAKRARALGMVASPLVHFLDLRTGRIISQPRRVPGVPTVPGYAP